ncbi:MAG TPA: alanine--tRNA ligase, partial [Tissierellaceae bacterium]|nr:alanine--tRNA ligase [Tissierellaceae bacterium]
DLSNYKYGNDDKKDISIRVITDHARAMTFLVSDGVLPSNEGRGYVLRRLIRRAARHGKLLGIEGEFLAEIVKEVIDSWKVAYKDLVTRQEQIERVIKAEEDKFQETIDQGIFILENYIKEMEDEGQKILDGDKAFKLYDTYGFPIDLTKEILEEKSLSVNLVEFNTKMEEQRDRARRARQEINSGWKDNQLNDLLKDLESSFTGYEEIKTHTEIIGLFKDNERVGVLEREDEGILILKKTPFYGEAGGQVGDIGVIYNENFTAKVLDTSLSNNDLTLHMVKLKKGSVAEGDKVVAKVEDLNRDSIKRNHSATHLLHKALKEVLGEHVNQAGSLVLPNRLRFDFTHFEAVSQRELEEIENRVNEKILKALTVSTEVTSLDRAEKLGAIGLFEDKYEDEVRVVKMGDYSIELCGGTHVDNTANIGLFKIISEGGIASGVRRIEAITGLEVYNYLKELEKDMDKLTVVLKTNREHLQDKASSMVEELREKDREIEKLKAKLATDIAKDIIEEAKYVEDIPIVSYKTDSMDVNALRNLGDEIRNRLDSAVVVLASTQNSKLVFISMVTKDLIDKGILAGNLVREVAKVTGGNGGGRPDMAQAGGKDISKLDEALDLVPDLVKKQLK